MVALRAVMFNHRPMVSPAPVVRRALESDAETLASIHVTAWREAYSELLPAEMLFHGLPIEGLPGTDLIVQPEVEERQDGLVDPKAVV